MARYARYARYVQKLSHVARYGQRVWRNIPLDRRPWVGLCVFGAPLSQRSLGNIPIEKRPWMGLCVFGAPLSQRSWEKFSLICLLRILSHLRAKGMDPVQKYTLRGFRDTSPVGTFRIFLQNLRVFVCIFGLGQQGVHRRGRGEVNLSPGRGKPLPGRSSNTSRP